MMLNVLPHMKLELKKSSTPSTSSKTYPYSKGEHNGYGHKFARCTNRDASPQDLCKMALSTAKVVFRVPYSREH